MVLDTRPDPVQELLRDDVTGILPDPAGLLRVILGYRRASGAGAVRGAYESDRAIDALSRVCLHLLGRVQRLEAGAPARPDMGVAPSEAEVAEAQDGLQALPKASRTDWRVGRTSDGQSMGDAIGRVLAAAGGCWLDLEEITSRVTADGWQGAPPRDVYVRRVLVAEQVRRGWELRRHPDDGRRSQYRHAVLS